MALILIFFHGLIEFDFMVPLDPNGSFICFVIYSRLHGFWSPEKCQRCCVAPSSSSESLGTRRGGPTRHH